MRDFLETVSGFFGRVRHNENIPIYLEDHPTSFQWLMTMVSKSPFRIGLWNPFQMAFHSMAYKYMGDPNPPAGVVTCVDFAHMFDATQVHLHTRTMHLHMLTASSDGFLNDVDLFVGLGV